MDVRVNEELRLEILRLFGEDQTLLAQLDTAREDPSFAPQYQERVSRLQKPAVFYTGSV
jgi:hypothetical protein